MIKNHGWFVHYFSGVCEGKTPKEVEATVYHTLNEEPIYEVKDFATVLETLLQAGFDGAIHPVLGKIELYREIPPGRPNVAKWEIACPIGKAHFEIPF